MSWILKIFTSRGIIIVPEKKPLQPTWHSIIPNIAKQLSAYFNEFKECACTLYGFEFFLCAVIIALLVYYLQRFRFKDIDELLQLKQIQVDLEAHSWALKTIRSNAETHMDQATTILKNTQAQLSELLTYIKKNKLCEICSQEAQQVLQSEKQRERDMWVDCIQAKKKLLTSDSGEDSA